MPHHPRLCLAAIIVAALSIAAPLLAQKDSVAGVWVLNPDRGDPPLMGKHPTE